MRQLLALAIVALALTACGGGGGGKFEFDRDAAVDLYNRSHPVDAVSGDLKKAFEQRRDDLIDQAKTWCKGGVSSVRSVVIDTRTDNSLGEVSTMVHAACPTTWDAAVAAIDG